MFGIVHVNNIVMSAVVVQTEEEQELTGELIFVVVCLSEGQIPSFLIFVLS